MDENKPTQTPTWYSQILSNLFHISYCLYVSPTLPLTTIKKINWNRFFDHLFGDDVICEHFFNFKTTLKSLVTVKKFTKLLFWLIAENTQEGVHVDFEP